MISEEKEAIEELKILKENYWEDDGYGYATAECQKTITALDMAIEALEQQPCDDCVSRQAVLDGLASIAKVKARSDAQKSLMGRIMFFVEQLPPVTPKEKTGHWIKYSIPRCGEQHYQCTSCGYYINFGQWGEVYTKQFKYCPSCSAKMIEPQESEVNET